MGKWTGGKLSITHSSAVYQYSQYSQCTKWHCIYGSKQKSKMSNFCCADIGNCKWFLRCFSIFANGLVAGRLFVRFGWMISLTLFSSSFSLPPKRPSYMFNGVLCIHLYLLLLLLSVLSETEQRTNALFAHGSSLNSLVHHFLFV